MFYLGNQTAKYSPDIAAPFKFALTNGFTAFEWFADSELTAEGKKIGWDFTDADAPARAQLRAISASGKMRFSVHAKWTANPLTELGAAAIQDALNFANEIGAPLVVVHLCEHAKNISAFAVALTELLYSYPQLWFAVENTPLNTPADFNQLFTELARLPNGERVGMTFDLGHANCGLSTRNDYLRFLNELSAAVRVIHVHLHENWGDRDAHLPLFTGAAAKNDNGVRLLLAWLSQHHFNGSLILEQWAPEILPTIVQRLREMLPATELAPTEQSDETHTASVTELSTAARAEKSPPPNENFSSPANDLTHSCEHQVDNAHLATLRTRTSWRTRLQWVRDILAANRNDEKMLATIAALLRFLASGELKCTEDGGHYRPNHHAALAREIENYLATSTAPLWLRRLLYPYLPSSAAPYSVAEPLTRIRDIAHRNDIPSSLKQRLKHDLQNKLHRSAGPEDLQTAREILAEITRPQANYSPSFVAEFTTFFRELSDFFNAPNLVAHLNDWGKQQGDVAVLCTQVINAAPLTAIKAAVTLREILATANNANTVNNTTLDIELENFVFMKLSAELQKSFALNADDSDLWFDLFTATLTNAALSNRDEPEFSALLAETAAWRENYNATNRLHALRLRATLARALRVAAAYQQKLFTVVVPASQNLGQVLNINPAAVAVFGEAILRVSPLFQLAKMAETATATLREILHLPAWTVIVPGMVRGKLVDLKKLDDLVHSPAPDAMLGEEKIIARLPHAAGDEEIPPAVAGIILSTPIPYLSHLAIRARESRTVLVIAEKGLGNELLNQVVTLTANEKSVLVAAAPLLTPPANNREKNNYLDAKIDTTPTTCGAKAENALKLMTFTDAPFLALPSVAIPFNVLDECLNDNHEYAAIIAELPSLNEAALLEKLPRLREIIMGLSIPQKILSELRAQFSTVSFLAARSSSNGEDLPNLAGAGLYDSVIGIKFADLPTAIKTVWASLWTRRAALSRQRLSIPPTVIKMAVLIQEALTPDYAFVLHTADPLTGERGKVNAEICVGLGETLAAANQPGRPYLVTITADKIERLSCADYSYRSGEKNKTRLNYAEISLSANNDALTALAEKLGRIGDYLETHYAAPQDVEGCVVGEKIYVVQTRPQARLT